jgi:hypothetical protein
MVFTSKAIYKNVFSIIKIHRTFERSTMVATAGKAVLMGWSKGVIAPVRRSFFKVRGRPYLHLTLSDPVMPSGIIR